VTALAAGFAALAGATGAFEQMQRNYPRWSAAIFAAAVVAGVLAVAAGVAKDDAEAAFAVVALAAFTFAAVAGVVFLVKARGDRPAPSIGVVFKQGPPLSVSGSVKSEQMTAKETLKVRVTANQPPSEQTPDKLGPEVRLYDASLGPDASGSVELAIDVTIASAKYRWVNVLAWVAEKPDACFTVRPRMNFKNIPGCVIMRIPESSAAP
jgi:hypothetical protein